MMIMAKKITVATSVMIIESKYCCAIDSDNAQCLKITLNTKQKWKFSKFHEKRKNSSKCVYILSTQCEIVDLPSI